MAAKVTFKITSKKNFSDDPNSYNPPYSEGQIIFVEGTGGIYVDFHNKRGQYGKTSSGINYVGITRDDPITVNKSDPTGIVHIEPDKEAWQPSANDMVVFNSKEYLWRKGETDGKYAWYEVGDEESPEWYSDSDSD